MAEGTVTLSAPVTWVAIGLLLAIVLFWLWPRAVLAELAVGAPVPTFRLPDQDGEYRSLEDYRGRWLVLYFYPKDDTPGCTTEACHFRDEYYRIRELGASVVGISLDNVKSHKAFAGKYHLPFPLLADVDHRVAREYGVLTRMGPLHFASRQTFIIDPHGRLARQYRKVSPATHVAEIITFLEKTNK